MAPGDREGWKRGTKSVSRFLDLARRAEFLRRRHPGDRREVLPASRSELRPFHVLTVASNKGGVGKTTLATNLAVYLRALRENLPILVLNIDDQTVVDAMFAVSDECAGGNLVAAMREGTFAGALRMGQYGVHYVPSSPDVSDLKHTADAPLQLENVLERTDWRGLVIVDTKSDLEILTQGAIAASDLVLIPVPDGPALREARKVFELLENWHWPRDRARIVLSMVDRRIKYAEDDAPDVLALLLQEIRRLDYPLLGTFLSSSPKVAALQTNLEGRSISILHGAPRSIVHRQMRYLAEDVLKILGQIPVRGA
jgi:cellulose biosynthesis protein BcsQ